MTKTVATVPPTNPSHVLPGEIVGASLWRPSTRPTTYASVSPAHTASSTVNAASRPCTGSARSASRATRPSPIHDHAEHRPADRDRRRLPRVGEALEQERERRPSRTGSRRPRRTPPACGGDQRQHEPEVAGDHDRPQRARHRVELVQREQPDDAGEHAQPPAAEPDDPEHERQADQRRRAPATRGCSDRRHRDVGKRGQRPPKRRLRRAYTAERVSRRCASGPKSGQSVSTKTSSA